MWGGGGLHFCTFIRLLLGCALMWVRNTTCQIRLQTSDFIPIGAQHGMVQGCTGPQRRGTTGCRVVHGPMLVRSVGLHGVTICALLSCNVELDCSALSPSWTAREQCSPLSPSANGLCSPTPPPSSVVPPHRRAMQTHTDSDLSK